MYRLSPTLALMGLSLLPCLASATSGTLLPPQINFDNSTAVALSANLAWDINHREVDAGPPTHAHDWRRQEVGLVARQPGAWDVQIFRDLHNDMWLGVVLGLQTKGLTGHDAGRIEIGNIKLASGLEGVAPTRHMPLMESAAATQVFHPMVRGGVNWTLERDRWLLDAGAFGRDIDGFYAGRTQLLRAAWTPTLATGAKGHFGLAIVHDDPARVASSNGAGAAGTARWAMRGVSSLLPDRLAGSGLLTDVDDTYRQNLQVMWVDGPFWLQSEYFLQQTRRAAGADDYHAHGGYLSMGWMLKAPSRRIVQGMLMQPSLGAGRTDGELVARVGRVDLDDAGIAGGTLDEWTVGANAYVGAHLKLQANLSGMHLEQGSNHHHVRTLQLRTQFFF